MTVPSLPTSTAATDPRPAPAPQEALQAETVGGRAHPGLALEAPRALLVRWDKKARNYLGLLKLACLLLWFRRYYRPALSLTRPRTSGGLADRIRPGHLR